jgi:UDP-N-acetylmuramate--alanine ligase
LFAAQLKPGGVLINRKGLELEGGKSYAANEVADIQAENIRIEDGNFWFDFRSELAVIENLQFSLPGLHNIENAISAIETVLLMGISAEKIKSALTNFKGVKRRFEYNVRTSNHIYIDDYAHHPEELKACFTAVKTLYPDKKLTVIFQPHLYSRTRDFVEGFAEVLAMTDELVLLDIYPAREQPIEGVHSAMLLDKVLMDAKMILTKVETLNHIKITRPELLLTVGAGDIDTLVKPLKNILENA